MPVPEIDRIAHEILDILSRDHADRHRPDNARSLVDGAVIAIQRELRKIDAASKPFTRCILKELESRYLVLEALEAVGDHAPSEFQARPVLALLRLYAALERAEMQERATPTPNLNPHDPSLLASSGDALNNVGGHDGEGTR